MGCCRSIVLVLLFILSNETLVSADEHRLNFLRAYEIETLSSSLDNPTSELRAYINVLRQTADSLTQIRPWSVTYHRCPNPDIDPHDYYSESTYWWPDPTDPTAPYIRKDGIHNPDRFLKHKDDLNILCKSVLLLSVAAYLFEEPKYAEKAEEFVRVWFIDPKTRMNPNAKYAQVIPNSDRKRGVGILDTRRFVYLLEGVQVLKKAGYWDEKLEYGLQHWFSEYLDWMLESYYGIDERERGNNHSTWYAVQLAAYAHYTGRLDIVEDTWQYARKILLEEQIESDGKMPREMQRTRSLSYMIFNLDAWTLLSRMAELDGIGFWTLENDRGGSLAKSVAFVFPYLENPKKWHSKQIISYQLRERLFLIFGGLALQNPQMIDLYCSIMSTDIIVNEVLLFFTNMMLVAGIL